MRNVKARSFTLLFLFIAFICYVTYTLERHESVQLVACFGTLFLLYGWIIQNEQNIKFWLIGSIIIRLSLLVALPNLSDDFYRFIWDGRLWAAGQHPFDALPADFLSQNMSGLDASLFEKLNSKEYFTIYPPVAQFVFWLAVKISPHSIIGSVMVMRSIILLAEVGSIVLMVKLLHRFELPAKSALLFALNPLVILELTGNLHFEAFVIFFLLLCVWLMSLDKIAMPAVSFAFAIGVKLLPVIFLPFLLGVLGWRKAFIFYSIAAISCVILFIPLYDPRVLNGFSQSLHLYFQKFEFNSSIYYLVREYGFWNVGYNTIQTTGWKLGLVSGILILTFSYLQGMSRGKSVVDKLFTGFLFILLIYFSFSTIVHPWYVTTLLAFSVFTQFRFVLLWTALIFLSYVGYSQTGFSENLWITAFEYVSVFGYLGYELLWKEKESVLQEHF